MEIGIDAEKDTLQSLIRSCLLELNKLKYDLTALEVERVNDNTPQRIKELEKDIVDKEREVSVIKFKAEDEINLLKKQLDEKDILIKNQEDRIYELDYVNNSLDEIKEYFAEQLRDYKKKELSDVNDRLNESFRSIAEKEATINSLSRTIDEYKIKVIKLENNVESQTQIMELEKQLELKNSEILKKESEINQVNSELDILKQQSIPKDEYLSLQTQFESEINAMDAEITNLKQDTFICSNLQIISASLMLCRPVTTLLIVVYEVREPSERYSKRTSQTRNADSSLVRSEMQCISMSMWKVEWMMCLLSVWLTER